MIAATKPFFGRIADRMDKRVQIVTGLLITGCAPAMVTFASSFGILLLVSSLFGLGISISTIATSAYVADVARKEHIGASMGALSSIMDIGPVSRTCYITGIIITTAGYTSGFLASFIIAIAIAGFFAVSVKEGSSRKISA